MKSHFFLKTLLCTSLFFLYTNAIFAHANDTVRAVSPKKVKSKAAPLKSRLTKQTQSTPWVTYKHADGAYSVKLPSKPIEQTKELPNPDFPDRPYKVIMSGVLNEATHTNYLVRYFDYPPGQYLADLSESFTVVLQQIEEKGEIVGPVKKIFKDGYEGRELDVIMEESYFEIKMFSRGNRSYMLMRQNAADQEKATADDFFSSFKFEPYEFSNPIAFTSGPIKVMMPGESVSNPVTQEKGGGPLYNVSSAYVVNKKSGGVYAIEAANLSKYLKYPDVDSLYRFFNNLFEEPSDSLVHLDDTLIGKLKGKIRIDKNLKGGNYKKTKMWIDADRFFCLFAIVAKEELESKQMVDFFETVTYQPSKQKFNLSASKAQIIADDLFQKDTTIYKNALAALSYYPFNKNELPIIYKILNRPFADDTLENGARPNLIRKLESLNDATTVPYLKTMYEAKNPAIIKYKALVAIPTVDSTTYNWYLKNLVEQPALEVDNYWELFARLSLSLNDLGKNLNHVLTLLERTEYAPYTLNLIAELLTEENKEQFLPLFNPHKDRITAKALADADEYIGSTKKYPRKAFSHLTILEEFKMTPLLDQFSNKLFKIDSASYLHTLSLAARIRNNLTLDQSLISAHLDSLSSRYTIMKAYFDAGRIEEVPSKYRSHEEFSRLLVHQYMSDEDFSVEELTKLGTINSEKGTFYVFEVLTVDDEKKYLMICGAFDEKKAKFDLDLYQAYTGWEEVEIDWQTQAKRLIKSIEQERK